MAKRDHSTFNINKDLLVYKAFYFFILGGFGSVFPYLPVYFRQIGLTADQVGLIVGMRPIIQFASAPFWAIMADKYRKRKAVLVMSVLSWLIMTLALAFVEPTNEICELRISNESHTHFVNYTKVKTGFFRRSLVPSFFVVQKAGHGVIESSPDLVVVPIMNNAESSQQKIASEDDMYSSYGDQNSSEKFQLTQLRTKTHSVKETSPSEPHERHSETITNTSEINAAERSQTEINVNNKVIVSAADSKLSGKTELVKTKVLLVYANNKSSLSDVSNSSATNVTARVEKSPEQQTQALTTILEKSRPNAANKSKDTKNLVKESDIFSHSAEDDENKEKEEKEILTNWDEISDASGSGQAVNHSLGKTTKSKRHDKTNTIISLQNSKKSSIKTKKSVPVVFDFSQSLQGDSTKNSANSSLQIIAFQSQFSETKAQDENDHILDLGSGIMEKKSENYSNNIEDHDGNKNLMKQMNELQPVYNFVSRANTSKLTFNKVKDKLKNSVFNLERKNNSNKDFKNLTKNLSRTIINWKEGFNSSGHNPLPAAKINLQAALTRTDLLHEGEMERSRGGIMHHRDNKVIDVPYSALNVLNHPGDIDKHSSSVKQVFFENTSDEQVESTESSGENSGFSENFEDEPEGKTNLTEPAKPLSVSVNALQQLKTTTTNLLKTNPDEINRIFVILMILIVVGEFLESPSFTLADAALLEHLGEERRYYGKQRLWGSLGFGIFSFIVGVLLEKSLHTVCGEPYTDYMICFCVFTLTMILTLFTSTKFHFEYNSASRTGASALSALCNIHYGSCLMAACFMGFGHGMSHNFINWFLEDLGGSKTLMGFAVICRSFADLTTFFVAGFVIKLVGQVKMMLICLFFYGVIFTSYSMLENSWSVLPIELLNGVTYAAAWSACTSYMAGASSVDAVATIQGILQGVYWGLGSGSGAISGGLMIHHIGAVATFRFTAGGFFLGAIAFGLAQWRYNKETAERSPQIKYSYLPATPESKDTEALLSGFLSDSPKSALGIKKSNKTRY